MSRNADWSRNAGWSPNGGGLFRQSVIGLLIMFASPALAQHIQWASRVIAFSSQSGEKGYSASQALGKPNKCPDSGDSPCAWMPLKTRSTPYEFIRVNYEHPMKIEQVGIAENYHPGSVTEVILLDRSDKAHSVYRAAPGVQSEKSRVLNIVFPLTEFEVNAVEVRMDAHAFDSVSEIDAIGISDLPEPIVAHINVIPNLKVGEREHLGAEINSPYDEVYPVISPNGKTLFVDRKDHPDNIGAYDNIWYSTLMPSGKWNVLKNIGPPLNNTFGAFVASITPDGNTLLLGGSYIDSTGKTRDAALVGNPKQLSRQPQFGLWLSERGKNGWLSPKQIEIKNNYTRNRFIEFCLATDRRTILLSLERPEGFGERDIYVTFLQADGSWSEPKDLGADVNTAADEGMPFLAADNKTLYFGSEGFSGFGSSDIFIARRLDDTWQHWSEPQNLGPPFNTPGWDSYYTVPASGEYAYFVSTQGSYGETDIFRAKLPPELRPQPVVLISGTVMDRKTNRGLNASIRYEDLATGKEVGTAISDPATGEYAISLPAGISYGFRAEAPGFIPISQNLDLRNLTEYKEISKDLFLAPLETGVAVPLTNIFFETGKWVLEPESYSELSRLIDLLHQYPNMRIRVAGNTDNVGSRPSNMTLSLGRANAVEHYLTQNGIAKERLEVKAFADTIPVASNDTEEGRAQNRRVDFIILQK